MTILITGGAGFIGSNLTRTLLSQGHHVVAVDNFRTSHPRYTKEILDNPSYRFFRHDITKSFPKKIRDMHIDEIYHLACPTGVPNLVPMASAMAYTCSLGTMRVLDLAKKHDARYLLTSSSESYGNPLVSPQKESYTGNVNTTGVRSPYEEGKRFSETLTSIASRCDGLQAKIVRIFNTYGPYMSLDDTRVIPRFILAARAGAPLPVHGEGEQIRTFCYVDDLVSGLMLVMEKGVVGEVYNLGSDRQVTIRTLAEEVIRITRSKSTISSFPRPSHDHQSRLPDISKATSLGWKQKISLSHGLSHTYTWLQSYR